LVSQYVTLPKWAHNLESPLEFIGNEPKKKVIIIIKLKAIMGLEMIWVNKLAYSHENRTIRVGGGDKCIYKLEKSICSNQS
jgi:hypothetical protein